MRVLERWPAVSEMEFDTAEGAFRLGGRRAPVWLVVLAIREADRSAPVGVRLSDALVVPRRGRPDVHDLRPVRRPCRRVAPHGLRVCPQTTTQRVDLQSCSELPSAFTSPDRSCDDRRSGGPRRRSGGRRSATDGRERARRRGAPSPVDAGAVHVGHEESSVLMRIEADEDEPRPVGRVVAGRVVPVGVRRDPRQVATIRRVGRVGPGKARVVDAIHLAGEPVTRRCPGEATWASRFGSGNGNVRIWPVSGSSQICRYRVLATEDVDRGAIRVTTEPSPNALLVQRADVAAVGVHRVRDRSFDRRVVALEHDASGR